MKTALKVLGILALVFFLLVGGCTMLVMMTPKKPVVAEVKKDAIDQTRDIVNFTYSAAKQCEKYGDGSSSCSLFKNQTRNRVIRDIIYAPAVPGEVMAEFNKRGYFTEYTEQMLYIEAVDKHLR
ncbi:predicted ORF [Xanthomonas phage XacN1]|nr:predicted ORF [Xanthomonas phage XacN1]BBA65707.1 predicted ORF [Xanthomonas phage XacN1]